MVKGSYSDAFHDALSHGAEIGYARTLASGGDSKSLAHFVEQRLASLPESEKGAIALLAEEILNAAKYVSSLDDTEDIDAEQIPTNPDLFGGDWGGKRIFWFGEWNIPGTDEWYKFSGTLPDITSYPDITVYAANLASAYIDAYPDKFVGPDGGVPAEVTVRILGIEKAF